MIYPLSIINKSNANPRQNSPRSNLKAEISICLRKMSTLRLNIRKFTLEALQRLHITYGIYRQVPCNDLK